MAEDLIRILITEAGSILLQHVRHESSQIINVEQDFTTLITTLESIRAIVIDAEMKEIQNPSVKNWVQNLKHVSYDIDDTLTDWDIAARKVNGNTSKSSLRYKLCFAFVFPCVLSKQVAPFRNIAKKIKRINKRLVLVDNEKNAFGFVPIASVDEEFNGLVDSSVDKSTVFGRDDEKDHLLRRLTNENSSPIVFIWGMGGIGKTTVAQLLFNSFEVQKHFDIKKWVPVGRASGVSRIAKAIVEGDVTTNHGLPLERVRDFVNGKKYLLVLDNVWEEDVCFWKALFAALNGGAPGSKILITSRNEGVGKMVNACVNEIKMFSLQMKTDIFMHHLGKLSDENTWTIFRRFAFAGRSSEFKESLKDTGRKISDKCKGLPLAAETVASLMVLKETKDEWEHVLNDNIWQLEELERRVSNPLLLSYYALPSPMKRCFCYCANFPKDAKIDAVNLIQIWMAQGYLGSDGNSEMEITGRKYLNSLVRRSLFQDPERNKDDGTIVSFKMHDMVHDVVSYLMENECLMVTEMHNEEEDKLYRYLTIIREVEDELTFPIPLKNQELLYTFSVQSFHDCPQIILDQDCVSLPPKFFNRFKYLKTLDMSRNMLLTIPDDVENLKNLCYLNLSYNPLSKLPETVCNLVNLQTLKLVGCHHLTELPQSIGNLEKLRHLEIDQTSRLVTLPKGVAKLTSLRTLSQFLIGTEDTSCSLGDLKQLNHLCGRLKIEGLNLADVSEVKEAELEKKEHLVDLHINCSLASDVVDVLQLNVKLVALHIDQYGGQRFPSWLAFLTNLKKVRLQEWANCIGLPPLGKLPSLKILHIEGFKALTDLGSEFLGVETVSKIGVAFPKLEKLKFSQMEKWENWDTMKDIKIMPCLHYLKLSHCEALQSLPLEVIGLPIKKLRIRSCVVLKQKYQKEMGKESEMVSHIPNVRIH